jgi:hypothetical protein
MLQKAKQLPGTERGTAAEENQGKVGRERKTGPDGEPKWTEELELASLGIYDSPPKPVELPTLDTTAVSSAGVALLSFLWRIRAIREEEEGQRIRGNGRKLTVVEHNAEFLLAAKNRSQAISVGMTAVGMDQSIF